MLMAVGVREGPRAWADLGDKERKCEEAIQEV